jgi:hypothetical protein
MWSAAAAVRARQLGACATPADADAPGRNPAGGERIVVIRRLIEKRVGAAVAVTCFEGLTPPPPPKEDVVVVADRGAGRATKRERCQLDRFQPGLN